MEGTSRSITIGDSVLSLIDDSRFNGESSGSTPGDLTLQHLFPSLESFSTQGKSSKTSLKTYNPKWERDPLLRTWIARHPTDPGKVVCCYCNSLVRAHKNDLLEHTRTVKHQRNYMPNVSSDEYKQFILDLNELKKEMKNMTNKKICSPNPPTTRTKVKRPNFNGHDHDSNQSSNTPGLVGFDWPDSFVTDDAVNQVQSSDDHDDVDGIIIDSPSDLLSVVLEEGPTTTPASSVLQNPVPSSMVKRKRRLQQSNLAKPNQSTKESANHTRQPSSGPQNKTLSSAQKFLKLLNAIQTEPLTPNELLLLKKSIDTRINSIPSVPKVSQPKQVRTTPSRNTNSSSNILNSVSRNKGITITNVSKLNSSSNHSVSRRRKQQLNNSIPSPVDISMRTEMIDVTPDVSDYGITEDDYDSPEVEDFVD